MEKAYKFRFYPNKEQAILFEKTFGCCRFVYNEGLAARKERYKDTGETISKYDLMKRLPSLKAANPWLKEVDAIALQSAIENMDAAYQNFFRGIKSGKRVGFPKFKSKKRSKAAYHTKQNIQVADRAVRLPKVGWVKCRVSAPVQGRILSATVSRTRSGKYFASICCTEVDIPSMPSTGAVVGIDLGLESLAVTSEGEVFDAGKHLRRAEKRLAALQRSLSRKSKGSKRREKARLQVARLQEHVANQRADYLHKLTTGLVRRYDIICVEDLATKNMMKNHRVAKSIADASWGELVRQLEYKAQWYGKVLVKADRFFPSSQRCSVCGHINPDLKDLRIRKWDCPVCGSHHDRDRNAAVNLREEGLRILSA